MKSANRDSSWRCCYGIVVPLLFFAAVVLFGLTGCRTRDKSSHSDIAARVNTWGAPWVPSYSFVIRTDKTMLISKYLRGKSATHVIKLTQESYQELLATITLAHDELQKVKQGNRVVDGASFQITVIGVEPEMVELRNYASAEYSLKSVPKLFDKLREIFPEEFQE